MLNWYYEKMLPLPYYNYTSEEDRVFKALVLGEDIVIGNRSKLYQVHYDFRRGVFYDEGWVLITSFFKQQYKYQFQVIIPENSYRAERLKSMAVEIVKKIKELDVSPLELYR